MRHEIIMPVLGMSQDTGVLVGWSKELGDSVKQDDILFEVETDKSVVEVPAGIDGYLVARLAAAGDEVPTGETIAIISNEQVADRVDRSYSALASPVEAPVTPAEEDKVKPVVAKTSPPGEPAPQRRNLATPGGKILASPKLKRLAHKAGLDLALLASTDLTQPYHARDFDALKQASESADKRTGVAQVTGVLNRMSARVPGVELESFLIWAGDHVENTSDARVIAAFAGASLADQSIVRIDSRGKSKTYLATRQLSKTVESDDEPDLIVHDLRGTLISSADLPPESAPVISVVGSNDELTLTLTCIDAQLAGKDAAVLLDNFAGRMADPLRHLF